MAFASVRSEGTRNDITANQASTLTQPLTGSVGEFFVLIVAVDNNQTTDGDEGAVTSVTQTANTWTKAAEFCNGQGGAQAGATCSVWYMQCTTAFSSENATINFSNSASRDKSANTVWIFSVGAGNSVAVEATNTLANDGADPGSLNATTANIECLRIRGIAGETNSTTALTVTSGWTAFSSTQTTGGGSAANMAVRGEWRISTGTGDASDPTFTSADHASVYVAFKEVATAKARPIFPRAARSFRRAF
jgi:hypothetical protein